MCENAVWVTFSCGRSVVAVPVSLLPSLVIGRLRVCCCGVAAREGCGVSVLCCFFCEKRVFQCHLNVCVSECVSRCLCCTLCDKWILILPLFHQRLRVFCDKLLYKSERVCCGEVRVAVRLCFFCCFFIYFCVCDCE